jgi:MarR family transcriptional regulator, organic hydroperoxide resistance regulator
MSESQENPGPAPSSIADVAKQYGERFPWGDQPSMEIVMRLTLASSMQRGAQARLFKSKGLERSIARYTILRILFFSEGRLISQKEIGDLTRATSANVTYLIDGLVGEGLVERVQDEEDRRFSYVRLTPAGKDLAETLVPIMVEFMNGALEGFSEEEKTTFIRLLEKYRSNAENRYLD